MVVCQRISDQQCRFLGFLHVMMRRHVVDELCAKLTFPRIEFEGLNLPSSHSFLPLAANGNNMLNANQCYEAFNRSIADYHRYDDVDRSITNPYPQGTFESLLYSKNWIDTVQWHLEDIVRNPTIDPVEGLKLKRRIDKSNQERTDIVERVDDYFLDVFKSAAPKTNARINSETPAWLLDRMSILMLKIY